MLAFQMGFRIIRSMLRLGSTLLVISFAALLGGCQAPRAAEDPTQLLVRIADRDRFFDQTLTTLREFDFQPRELDRERGIAIAGPTTGKQWFEFWRRDVQGPYQVLESSLHTIRRIVTVRVDPQGDGGASRLTVQVDKSRFSSPERQVTTSTGALGIYSERLPTTEGLRNARHALDQWIPLGRDAEMESYLMDQIVTATNVEIIPGADNGPATSSPASQSGGGLQAALRR